MAKKLKINLLLKVRLFEKKKFETKRQKRKINKLGQMH